MNKKFTPSQSEPARRRLGEGGFLGPRLLVAVLVCAGVGYLVTAGTSPGKAAKAASHGEAPASASQRASASQSACPINEESRTFIGVTASGQRRIPIPSLRSMR